METDSVAVSAFIYGKALNSFALTKRRNCNRNLNLIMHLADFFFLNWYSHFAFLIYILKKNTAHTRCLYFSIVTYL